MSSLPCTTAANAAVLRSYVTNYTNHTNQLKVNGSVFVSTFSGESCTFGASSVNQGWINTIKTNLTSTYFMPSFFVDPATFKNYPVMDGAFNVSSCRCRVFPRIQNWLTNVRNQWNSGWPMGNYDINFSSDQTYLNNLGNKSYMAAVSPWFFTVSKYI